MTPARPHYLPIPYQDSTETGRLILRDGPSAIIQVARPADKQSLTSFFAGLPEKSRFLRFFTVSKPSDRLIESFCDDSDPRKRLTLVVRRSVEDRFTIIAAGSYMGLDASTAEVAMAVHDRFHGKGIGTILLERLALLAVMNGFRFFRAVTMAENKAMLDVFRDSGFDCRTKMDGAYVEVDFSVAPTEATVSRAELRDRLATVASLRPFFQPASVALIGASRNPASIGGRILSALVDAGFRGAIYPVNPTATKIGALTVYSTIDQVSQPVDLAVVAVPPRRRSGRH